MTYHLDMSPEVRRLLEAAEQDAGGDLRLAATLLYDRLIFDPNYVAERAILIRWLAGTTMTDEATSWRWLGQSTTSLSWVASN
jgi:hypothetical protein